MRRLLLWLLLISLVGGMLFSTTTLSFANLSQSDSQQSLPLPNVPVLSNQAVQSLPLLPARGPITSNFGWRSDPINGSKKFHAGLDIGAPSGAPVYVTQGGIVAYSGFRSGYGQVVVVQHHPQFYTLYAHLSERFVSVGSRVDPGQTIAKVGSSGRVTGPHLHFETILNHKASDPVTYLTYLNQHPPISPKVYLANMHRPVVESTVRQSTPKSSQSAQAAHFPLSSPPVAAQKQSGQQKAKKSKWKTVNLRVPLPLPNKTPNMIRRFIPSAIKAPVPVPSLSFFQKDSTDSKG